MKILLKNLLYFLSTYRLVVTATDRGSPRLAGSATLTVIIVDQNDNSPTIPLPKEVRIPESKYFGQAYSPCFLSHNGKVNHDCAAA